MKKLLVLFLMCVFSLGQINDISFSEERETKGEIEQKEKTSFIDRIVALLQGLISKRQKAIEERRDEKALETERRVEE